MRDHKELASESITGSFLTLPLKPTNLRPDDTTGRKLVWTVSDTPHVSGYRVSGVPCVGDDDETMFPLDMFVPQNSEEAEEVAELSCELELPPGAEYEVTVAAVVEFDDEEKVESEELKEVVKVDEEGALKVV